MMKGRDILAHLAIKYSNNWKAVYQAIKAKELIEQDELGESLSMLEGDFITIIDEDYPEEFKEVGMPPFIIFLSEADREKIGGDSERDFLAFEETTSGKRVELGATEMDA